MNGTKSTTIAVMFITCSSTVLTPPKFTTQCKTLNPLYQGMNPHEDKGLVQLMLADEEAEENKRSLLYSSMLQCLCMPWGLQILYRQSMDLLGTTEGAALGAHAGGGRGHHRPHTERFLQGSVSLAEGGSLLYYHGRETATPMPWK